MKRLGLVLILALAGCQKGVEKLTTGTDAPSAMSATASKPKEVRYNWEARIIISEPNAPVQVGDVIRGTLTFPATQPVAYAYPEGNAFDGPTAQAKLGNEQFSAVHAGWFIGTNGQGGVDQVAQGNKGDSLVLRWIFAGLPTASSFDYSQTTNLEAYSTKVLNFGFYDASNNRFYTEFNGTLVKMDKIGN